MLIEKASSAGQVGKYAAEEIQARGGTVEEKFLKDLAAQALERIKGLEPDKDKWQARINSASRDFRSIFPNCHKKQPGYRWFEGGKEADAKWKHQFLEFFTLGRQGKVLDYDPGEQTAEQTIEQPTEQPAEQAKKQRKPRQPKQPKQTLKTMTIEQLELDTDTQAILTNALEHSGMALEDFIKQAIKVYAKTVTGKAKQLSEDLANIPTQDLLNNPKYSTRPSRAEELTKRAIRAIKFFNANKATENADRWMITQSAIASLTGSRQGTIKQILEQYKDDIDSHNQTYGLNPYSNRKPGKDITEIINLAELVPNGVD